MDRIYVLLTVVMLILGPSGSVFGDRSADVKMIHSEAKIFYHETFVAWSTESETAHGEYMIEATENGKDWFLRGRLRSHGSATQHADYQFVDKREDRLQRYRLRLVDSRGRSTVLSEMTPENYSVEVKVEEMYIEKERKLLLEYSIDQDQELMVRIYNRIGEQVFTKVLPTKVAGEYIYHLDIGHLKADNYLLVVTQVLLDRSVAEKAFQIKK